MKSAKQIGYTDAPAYNKLVDLMRQRAAEDGRNMSEAELHRSARNLMGYVELVCKINNVKILYIQLLKKFTFGNNTVIFT